MTNTGQSPGGGEGVDDIRGKSTVLGRSGQGWRLGGFLRKRLGDKVDGDDLVMLYVVYLGGRTDLAQSFGGEWSGYDNADKWYQLGRSRGYASRIKERTITKVSMPRFGRSVDLPDSTLAHLTLSVKREDGLYKG
jgi:hypothetical protein